MKRIAHPDSATLALFAGGDLGWFQAWRTKRHAAGCGDCRDEISSYRAMRELLPQLNEMPEVNWDQLAGEMRANIRLGIAAGECVREEAVPAVNTSLFTGFRAAAAAAATIALLVTALTLHHPTPSVMSASVPVVQATGDGVERRAGEQGFAFKHENSLEYVTYSAGAQGSMGASYVDPKTNLVTMTKVYVE